MQFLRLVTLVAAIFFVGSITHADETRGSAILNQARAGSAAMETSFELLQAGETEAAEEKRAEAEANFDEVTKWGMTVNPEKLNSSSAAQFAEALELASQFDLSARGYKRAYDLDPQESYAIAAARNYRRISPSWYDDAINLLMPLKAESANAELHEELSHIYHISALLDLAEQSWSRALELNPESPRAKVGMALIDVSNGLVLEANTALNQLVELDPRNIAFLTEQLPRALARMERRQIVFADTAENHAAFAQLLARVGHNFDALLAIQHATLLDATNYSWYNLQGGLLMQQGSNTRAAEAYRQSLALNADQPRTRELLAQAESAAN